MVRKRYIIVVLVAVLVCGVVIVFASARPVTTLRAAAVRIMEPAMRLGGDLGYRISGARVPSGFCSGCEEERLRREVAEVKLAQVSGENESLKRFLAFKERAGLSAKPANVLLYNQEWDQEWLVIDAGEEDGLREGNLVVDEDQFLVGSIAEVGRGFAKVAVASNQGRTLSVGLVALGSEVLAKGLGARAFAISLVPHDASVHTGDILTLFSKSNRAMPTIVVGRMVSVDDQAGGGFKTGRATLLAHPERRDRVMVLTGL